MDIINDNPYRLLGVYANSPTKERVANESKLKAFLKVGRQVTFPLDMTQFLPAPNRTIETIAGANAKLTLPADQIKYAQFWFLKVTPIDNVAFNNLLAGDMTKALEIWTKATNASSLQNRLVCSLIRKDYQSACSLAERLYAGYAPQLISIVGGKGTKVPSTLTFDFLDTLCDDIGTSIILGSVNNPNWKKHISTKAVSPIIERVQSAVAEAKATRGKSSDESYQAGVKLMNGTKKDLEQLKNLLPDSDLQYQMIADKLGLEILQCGIDYYNDSDEPDAAHKAMLLQNYALTVVVGKMAKDRCQENVNILKKIIASLPPQEVFFEDKAIKEELKKFNRLPDKISYSIKLIKGCVPYVVAIKEKLGKTHQYYLQISTIIVNNALGNVISEVNEAQEADFDTLKAVLIAAWRTQLYMDKFDLEPEYKEGRYKESRVALHKIISDCKGFESKHMSFMYRYGCGWCNDLDVSDVDLRSEEEYYMSCEDLVSYKAYIKKYPSGKYVTQAKKKIEELEFKNCRIIADYQRFIREFPNSLHVAQAKKKIEELEFNNCRTIADYQRFIREFPNSLHVAQVKKNIEELEFKNCRTIADYQRFIREFPNSLHVAQAKRIIEKIHRQDQHLAVCKTTAEVVALFKSEKANGVDIGKFSSKAFDLSKNETDWQTIISAFGNRSVGGQKAEKRIDEIEKIRKAKRKRIFNWAIGIVLVLLVLLVLFVLYLIWGYGGILGLSILVAFIGGLVAKD